MVMSYATERRKLGYMQKEIMQGSLLLLVNEEEEDQEHVGDNITKWTGLTGDRLLRSVEDRSQWRKIIGDAENAGLENSGPKCRGGKRRTGKRETT